MNLGTFATNLLNILQGHWVIGIITVILILAVLGALLEWHQFSWATAIKVLFAGAFIVSVRKLRPCSGRLRTKGRGVVRTASLTKPLVRR